MSINLNKLSIVPSIGVARVGNSEDFYLAPDEIGGLPKECDGNGNASGKFVSNFKKDGKVRKQAAEFQICVENSYFIDLNKDKDKHTPTLKASMNAGQHP